MDMVTAVDAYLDRFTAEMAVPENLREAVRYALLGGGKRLRPVLAWHAAQAVGGRGEISLPAGAAIELVHAFSLVHDDLPAMDDDDLRRGRPTLHRHTSEAMAILAGDAMLNLAFQLLCEKIADPRLARDLMRELAVGTTGMIAGQIYDTLGGFPAGVEGRGRLELIHVNKTGALIRASCRMGAMCALADLGVSAEEASRRLALITQYGDAVGLMFQIVDDVLDVTQTTEHLGKKSNKDIDAGKLTYPGVLGLDASHRAISDLLDRAETAVASFGSAGEHLANLARFMAVRTK